LIELTNLFPLLASSAVDLLASESRKIFYSRAAWIFEYIESSS